MYCDVRVACPSILAEPFTVLALIVKVLGGTILLTILITISFPPFPVGVSRATVTLPEARSTKVTVETAAVALVVMVEAVNPPPPLPPDAVEAMDIWLVPGS